MKTLTVLLLTIASSSAFAANATEAARTGVLLDVARTISVTDTSNAYGVVPVDLVYDDSNGVRHTVSYSVLGNGCSGD
jgi:hypothetical protein